MSAILVVHGAFWEVGNRMDTSADMTDNTLIGKMYNRSFEAKSTDS